ncbi:MAG: hypothetical protein Q8K04_13340 [Lutibacter sp.]|jgi:tetratricopeptide (TPR) repeat protein|nr:hypothetical protein [Lutibacter sp.]MDP3945306.1 hypothetical protein [Lutibacter sp.]
MKKTLLFLIITSNLIFSQEREVDKLILLGNQEFNNNNVSKAKEFFEKAFKIDSLNKDVLFNLAATEIRLNNKDKACKLWQKVYKLKDSGTRDLILRYCGEIEHSEFMFVEDIDSKPQFIYKDKAMPLMVGTKLNPVLSSLFLRESKKSEIIKKYRKQRIFLISNINISGNFYIRALMDKPDELKMEIESIFNKITSFVPSKYNGQNVEFIGGYSIPFYFD